MGLGSPPKPSPSGPHLFRALTGQLLPVDLLAAWVPTLNLGVLQPFVPPTKRSFTSSPEKSKGASAGLGTSACCHWPTGTKPRPKAPRPANPNHSVVSPIGRH